MNPCPPCSGDCRQGRDCPSHFDSDDHPDGEHRLCSVQTIGLVLALFGAVGFAMVFGVVGAVGRAAGWW